MRALDNQENLEQENKRGDYVPVEEVSFSFVFFLVSGAALLVTLWAFWDDEYARRGYKEYQETFFKAEYVRAEDNWKKINSEIASKEEEIRKNLAEESGRLEDSKEFQRLVHEAREEEIRLAEVKEEKKFAGSRLDEAYYYYKKAQHGGENFDVELANMKAIEQEIQEIIPRIEAQKKVFEAANDRLLAFKARQMELEKELQKLTLERSKIDLTLDYYKPFPFFWKPAEILQTVIPGSGRNNFSEIIYKVDRCQTCHIAYGDDYYKDYEQPLKSHPNMDILIGKHPPEKTGCTWCHLGQGTATAPAEDAHGSHHEMDQTVGINEPILHGDSMQATCRNCHAEVLDLEGAPLLSKGKKLFIKLGCHGCHLAEGYSNEAKVGPQLLRIGSKVDASWLYRWVKNPREYLPKTRMPDFQFDDKDALATVAYLLAASDKEFKLPVKFESGNAETGKKQFESIGCYACHSLNGKGEEFGPDLSRIASKTNADWLVSWLSGPQHINPKSKMPDLRLSPSEAANITAYLMQFGTHKSIPGIEKRVMDPRMVEYGETVVRRRGCFACHDIKGMEKEGRIAPELSSFGRKQVVELEFGDSHVPHTWDSWARTKLKKPDSFRTERVLDKMPNFHLKPDEIDALVVLLRGFNGTQIPERYRKVLNEREKNLEAGRRLVERYNCRGCHHVEGEGGRIQKYLSATTQYPPPLELGSYHVGERIKSSWLFSFLKNPTPVRTWIKTRMPTFNLSDDEVTAFTKYFEALAPIGTPYEAGLNVATAKEKVQVGVEVVNYMDCGKCHDDGAKGIEFSIASDRLRENWIPGWLKNTREMIPWTKMPSHWDKKGDQYEVPTKFRKLKTLGPVDKQVDSIRDFIVGYNTADVDFTRVLGEEAEDEGGDEEGMDEEEGYDEEEEE